ncbi:hypothetical protein CEUSTIGMA_g13249.t1 [Chlamydomonas eustigma]|uniref:Uncharacterized protein n=1 Tax=Chlamydomonas eustigma TaxID=1157962 RepID=A0A250XS03_9CHLO|nr:hypothetical protein CEUSTIGMA_g13249.t1 [Chlamydomonas eustigma]|eukprot:GAX85834.1 hypothetical protein CEUSTIGMA_g13249.t1 [Chlamydomonas eustigma]
MMELSLPVDVPFDIDSLVEDHFTFPDVFSEFDIDKSTHDWPLVPVSEPWTASSPNSEQTPSEVSPVLIKLEQSFGSETCEDNSECSCGPSSPSTSRKRPRRRQAHRPPASKQSRWSRDKSKMNDLENIQQEKLIMATIVEQENRHLKLRTQAMEHVLAARERQLSILSQYDRLCGPASKYRESDEAQQWFEVASASISTLACKVRIAVEQWTDMISEINANAMINNFNANEPLLQALAFTVNETCALMGHAFTLNPSQQFRAMSYRLDLGCMGEPAGQLHWDHAAAELQLSEQQLVEIQACWEIINQNMAKSQSELVMAKIEMLSTDSILRHLELQKIMSDAMQSEGNTYRTLCFVLYGRIFTPLQMAKAVVHSYPYFPNAIELVSSALCMHTPNMMKP